MAAEEREVVPLKKTRKRVRDFFPAEKEIGVWGSAGSRDPTSPVVPSFVSSAPARRRAWKEQSCSLTQHAAQDSDGVPEHFPNPWMLPKLLGFYYPTRSAGKAVR